MNPQLQKDTASVAVLLQRVIPLSDDLRTVGRRMAQLALVSVWLLHGVLGPPSTLSTLHDCGEEEGPAALSQLQL